ncbi:MAG TPA: DUF4214 domain-containing protein [Pyrinomonadaceae bacterium]|nr:DUF4214 domain-containing protein [Pyrinomonadaceae bacterium]
MKFAVTLFLVALLGVTALGQSAPTLRIVTDDPGLPSELFYGDIKVKPLRLRPGTNQKITIDDSDFFIQQHYIDFLGRMPEPGGFQGWLGILNNCPTGSKACDRVEVSAGFFRSAEFQDRGYFIYRFYSAAFGRIPLYAEFIPDRKRVSGFQSDQQLEASKVAFINDFMARSEFRNKYDALTDPEAYVNTLVTSAGVNLPQKQGLIDDLKAGRKTRAEVLRAVSESSEVYQKYYNQAFVIMQYHGYLHRDADISYLSWIKTMEENGGDYRVMIDGFVNSLEYRNRF